MRYITQVHCRDIMHTAYNVCHQYDRELFTAVHFIKEIKNPVPCTLLSYIRIWDFLNSACLYYSTMNLTRFLFLYYYTAKIFARDMSVLFPDHCQIFVFNLTIGTTNLFCIFQSRRQSSSGHQSLHHLMLKPIQRFPQILALLQVSN